MLQVAVNKMLKKLGLRIDVERSLLTTDEDRKIVASGARFSMVSQQDLEYLLRVMVYLDRHVPQGDIVECGVWKGGCSLVMMLKANPALRRNFHLFDTYAGLPKPDRVDVDYLGRPASNDWHPGWNAVGVAQVQGMIEHHAAQYPRELVHYHVGMVEETLPPYVAAKAPVALARLDTDWYSSTKVELELLWPLVVVGGLVILDDYGHYLGARKATDEYFADKPALITPLNSSSVVVQKMRA